MSDTEKNIIKCNQCEKPDSILWRKQEEGGQICNDCFQENQSCIKQEFETAESNGDETKKLRKSTRSTRYKPKCTPSNIPPIKVIPKGKGRRCIFKKTPYKTPTIPVTSRFCESIFYKDTYLQIGDIVSLVDVEDDVYYAQIRGFLIDIYCEKSAFISWLIPTKSSPPPNECFDPATYLIGPDEEFPRKLSVMTFVMHAPSDYYHNKNTPYPTVDYRDDEKNYCNFIWTNIGEVKINRD